MFEKDDQYDPKRDQGDSVEPKSENGFDFSGADDLPVFSDLPFSEESETQDLSEIESQLASVAGKVGARRLVQKEKSPLRRFFGVLGDIFTVLLFLIAVFFVVVLIVSKGRGQNESFAFLGYQAYIVQSGSMEPTIHTGSVVFDKTESPDDMSKGDVITFRVIDDDQYMLVTHRIIDVKKLDEGSYLYTTKGDWNEVQDPDYVSNLNVLGVVQFSIPLLGYIVGFLRGIWGLLILVILPATIIIVVELIKLIRFSKQAKLAQNSDQ